MSSYGTFFRFLKLLRLGRSCPVGKLLQNNIWASFGVCHALDIRYLWVDALCIIQGDRAD